MTNILKIIPREFRSKSSMGIILIAAILVEVTSGVQYWYSKKVIQSGVESRAKGELEAKGLEIEKVTTAVEVAIDNMVWAVEAELSHPENIPNVTLRLLEQNPQIIGFGVAFVADYYPQYGRWCELYITRREEGKIESAQIGGPDHDYLQSKWFQEAVASNKGYWSEPYYDEKGARMMLCSYFVPVHDQSGKTVALLGADVSLDWLSELISDRQVSPSSFNLLISRTGQIMACTVDSLVLLKNIEQVTADLKDTTVGYVNREMMAGHSGQATIATEDGDKRYVFYDQMDDGTGWSMAIVCSDREIYGNLRQVSFNLFLLMVIGMILMGYIILRSAKNAINLQIVNSEKERIGSELRIASEIQKSMLPKSFPPYPERDDVEIYGSQEPAKEVGGDLFDFYIRDEKLFFCIGDVSGKGVPASLVMAVTRSLFRTLSAHLSSPERIVAQMNDSMAQTNDTNMFVTMFLGVLDLPTGRLRYCNAGHCSPLLIAPPAEEKQPTPIPCLPNLPLGILPGYKYVSEELLVRPRSTVFLYTDGLTEAENAMHAQFGEERMKQVLQQMDTNSPLAIVTSMTEAVRSFVGSFRQSDDLTMLAVCYTKEQLDLLFSRDLTLQNDIEQVPLLTQFVDEVCESIGLPSATAMQMNLALEEAVVNCMKYAYPLGVVGNINISARASNVRLKFVISDSGIPFDPTAHAAADTTLPAEERPIGGLGIHLVRTIMDSINYERINDKNVLTLRKKLN